MRSIRHRLLFWLLSGAFVVLLATGATTFFAIRYVLTDRIDGELQQSRKAVQSMFARNELAPGSFAQMDTDRGGRTPRLREDARWQAFDDPGGDLLYQVADRAGTILATSPSLGDRRMQGPSERPDPRQALQIRASDGTPVRARIDRARSPSGEVEIIVARDLTALNRTLWVTASAILGAIVLAALIITGVVETILRRVLAPLRRLGEQASDMDAERLGQRFEDQGMPQELEPIANRLNGLMARLERSFERERRFSSDVAHELRTPIAEISAMSEAALRFPDKVAPDQFEEMLATSRDMQRMVECLSQLARWEDGAVELNVEEIDLTDAVRQSWKNVDETARHRGLKVAFSLEERPTLSTDPALFLHILDNLFSNAAEYATEGGRVEIEGAMEPGGKLCLCVKNSVDGLTAEDVGHLFDRFWRHEASRSERQHSGLGLALAQSCAHALSMELSASLEGGMLTFRLVSAP